MAEESVSNPRSKPAPLYVNFPIYWWRFCMPTENGFLVPSAPGSPFSLSIFGSLSELGKAPFFTSWDFISKSWTVKNYLFCSILSDILVESWSTCVQIYRRNDSLHHILMIIITIGDYYVRCIAIASPEQRECAPIFMGPKPNCLSPRIWTAAHNFVWMPMEVIVDLFSPYPWKCWPDFLHLGWCLCMIRLVSQCFHSRNGKKRWWFDLYILKESFRSSFFLYSKVILSQSVFSMSLSCR